MALVSVLCSLGIYLAQRRAAEDAQRDLERDFQLELAALHRLQDLRNAAVADRSAALARNARIHAALEDNALDLLYPSAQEEMQGVIGDDQPNSLDAHFYRFIDSRGQVIPPGANAGTLLPNEEAQLVRRGLPREMETGYLLRGDPRQRPVVEETIAVPIRSTETNEIIAALVLGFRPVAAIGRATATGLKSGILVSDHLQLAGFTPAAEAQVLRTVAQQAAVAGNAERTLRLTIADKPWQLFFKRLNPQSHYPPAYEICLYPLDHLVARQRQLRGEIIAGGVGVLALAFVVSQFLSRRLSQPVEELAVVSETNRAQRQQAEAQLQLTTAELQRSSRFSADASHQLKNPITLLRVGLDSLLARPDFPAEVYEEISSLVHQTYRLTGLIDDLLLLSRMDAGKLRLNLLPVDLARLVAEWNDDFSALPNGAKLQVKTELPNELLVAGERQFTALVLQNLLDNARKYNCPGGTIRLRARVEREQVELRIANTGRGIPEEAQPDIFERFHRASAEVPGHGLGLNLARELMRLHGGELRLVRSDARWTEFSLLFAASPSLG